jgi:hypothetical protein
VLDLARTSADPDKRADFFERHEQRDAALLGDPGIANFAARSARWLRVPSLGERIPND